MKIWDIHCHLPSRRLPGNLIQQTAQMLKIADRLGIEKIGAFLRTDGGPSRDTEIRDMLMHFRGRVFGFVWCNLFNVNESIDKLNRWVGEGPMVGLKLGGGSGICSKPEYDPVFARAIELKAVIYQHTWIKLGGNPPHPGGGNLPRESQPNDIVQLAARYPDYPFICGHTGGDWELGIRTVRDFPNVSVELGGGYPSRGQVEMAVREIGAERVIYGSDVTGRGFASQIGKVAGAAISEKEKALIFDGNLRRMMKPILETKGYPV